MAPDNDTFEAEQDAQLASEVAMLEAMNNAPPRERTDPALLAYRARRKAKAKAAKASRRKNR